MARLEDFQRMKRDKALFEAINELDRKLNPRPFTQADWDHIEQVNAMQKSVVKAKVMTALTALDELMPPGVLKNLGFTTETIKAIIIAKTALEIAVDAIIKPPVEVRRV